MAVNDGGPWELRRRPIVIVGIAPRSGTNFLARLVEQHPDCAPPALPVKEDFLLMNAPLLVRYADRTSRLWPTRWGDRAEARRALIHGLGVGLLSFLVVRSDGRRAVSKTPTPHNLPLASSLLSDADLVVLVRDGRAVVESLHAGFRHSYTRAIAIWRSGARSVLRFRDQQLSMGNDLRWMIVRYEDLVTEPKATLEELFGFLRLDSEVYDFDAAASLPVQGSSFRTTTTGIDWQPAARTDDFRPLERHAGWSRAKRERFRRRAGAEQAALGFEVPDPARPRAMWLVYDLGMWAVWPLVMIRDLVMRGRRQFRLRFPRRPEPSQASA